MSFVKCQVIAVGMRKYLVAVQLARIDNVTFTVIVSVQMSKWLMIETKGNREKVIILVLTATLQA